MRTAAIITSFILLCAIPCVHGQEIKLKRSGIVSYRYSLDGKVFSKIGTSTSGLARVIRGDTTASFQLADYHKIRNLGQTITIVGVVIGAVGCLAASATDDDSDSNTPKYVYPITIGGSICLAGIITSISANSYLTSAVDTYNTGLAAQAESAGRSNSGYRPPAEISLNVAFRF